MVKPQSNGKSARGIIMTQQDIDLQKIQVLESSFQGWFNFKTSLVAGSVVGILILIATLQYENIFPLYSIPIFYLIVLLAGFYMVSDLRKTHEDHISFVNSLMLRVERREKLESIEELRKIKKESLNSKKSNNDKISSRLKKQFQAIFQKKKKN
jgi:hypothetical protein